MSTNRVPMTVAGESALRIELEHLKIKDQHPFLDIRFVFSNSRAKLNKGAKSTYGDWCDKHGFLYADKRIPDEWLLKT